MIWLRKGSGGGSCEHFNKPSGSIKCWEIVQWLSYKGLLKKDSTAGTKLVKKVDSATFLICFRQVTGSNTGRYTDYPFQFTIHNHLIIQRRIVGATESGIT
jgi:hypothetical protein